MRRRVAILTGLLVLAGAAQGADAEKAAREFLEARKAVGGKFAALKDPALATAVPGRTFFTLHFPQYPVVRVAPEGFSSSNVLAIDEAGKVTLIKSADELKKFATSGAMVGKSNDGAKAAAKAWLLLSAELVQDGFYKFQVVEDSLKLGAEGDRRTASGRLIVTQGGNGEINVDLVFNGGKVADAGETVKIRPGPRPICQATLLLHPEPLVRRICEQDLLVMGRPARDYLMEQRAKASPELQRAIDRVWAKIEAADPLPTAAPVPAEDAEKAARGFVEAKKATNGALAPLKSDAVSKVFPDRAFFTVRFRQWPVAIAPAEGFASSNLLVVDERGETTLFTGGMQLAKLFQKTTARDEKAALAAVRARLALEAELLQDGFYKFQLVEESLTTKKDGDKLVASGRMAVAEGGNGEIVASLTFAAGGALAASSLNHTVKPGVRPRCQATLLLHAEPLVREICEQDLLVMGRAALPYLAEQRAKASPELQRAIDRVRERIEAGR